MEFSSGFPMFLDAISRDYNINIRFFLYAHFIAACGDAIYWAVFHKQEEKADLSIFGCVYYIVCDAIDV